MEILTLIARAFLKTPHPLNFYNPCHVDKQPHNLSSYSKYLSINKYSMQIALGLLSEEAPNFTKRLFTEQNSSIIIQG